MQADPIGRRLARRTPLILDGGLATELERKGADLDDPLWSAKTLVDAPRLIGEVHRDYLRAGADIITTASYQASIPGFVRRGHTRAEADALLDRTFDLAAEARDENAPERDQGGACDELPALIAVSIGPYGAWLADGSEYRGRYDATAEEIAAFHRPRLAHFCALIRDRGPDDAVIAFETIPSLDEAILLAELLEAEPDVTGWMSFCCVDDRHCAEGQPIAECARAMSAYPSIRAIGVNCTAPDHVAPLVETLAAVRDPEAGTDRPILAYPNAGGTYDIATRAWRDTPDATALVDAARAALAAGASIIGGCCRTTPADIRRLAALRTSPE